VIFYNTLFDEKAASHMALGFAFRFNMQDGETMSPEEFAAAGGNYSRAHVDFMIGSNQMDIDGIRDGRHGGAYHAQRRMGIHCLNGQ